MFVYKKLKPSDVSITPFEAHKQYSFSSSSAGSNGITFRATSWTSESKHTYSGDNIDGNFNHALAWREAGISFFEQSLPSVLQTLERRFDVPISWSRQAAGRFGGEITAFYSAPLNLERILTDITTIKSLHYVSHSGGYQIIDRTETQPKNP